MFYAHDPQTGPMSRDQIPGFLQSIRCELITFYAANKQRHALYDAYNAIGKREEALNYPFYNLAPDLFGGIYLDLKVVDTLGLPGSNTSFNRVLPQNATDTVTWHAGPSFSDTNTYEMVRNFLIRQDHSLAGAPISILDYEQDNIPRNVDPFQCYRAIPQPRPNVIVGVKVLDFDGLARGDYPKLEQFQRMKVNLIKPLAAWLQENASDTWSNYATTNHELMRKENIVAEQTTYSFTVQVQLGLDVTYSLVSTRWNPLAVDASASSQQTSFLQFVLNGPGAQLTNGAKLGTAAITSAGGTLTWPLALPNPPSSR